MSNFWRWTKSRDAWY